MLSIRYFDTFLLSCQSITLCRLLFPFQLPPCQSHVPWHALQLHSISILKDISTRLSPSAFDYPTPSPTTGDGGGSDFIFSSNPPLQTGTDAALVFVRPVCSRNPALFCGAKLGDDRFLLKTRLCDTQSHIKSTAQYARMRTSANIEARRTGVVFSSSLYPVDILDLHHLENG
jgi:hypothetical protein